MAVTHRADGSVQLAAEDVSVRFGGVTALSEVSVAFSGPEIIGIVGPNGSGKSTLMGVLSGLVKPQRGRVLVNGHDLTGKSPVRFARSGVRRSFQTVRLVPTLTIRDNLLVGLGRADRHHLQRAEDLADGFGLIEHLDKWPSSVPGGVQRLVQVGSVILTEPSVVLLDEPAAGLTEDEAHELGRIVLALGEHALVLIVEHNMQMIYELCERVVALINGRVAADGPVAVVREDEQFRSAYLGLPPEAAGAVVNFGDPASTRKLDVGG